MMNYNSACCCQVAIVEKIRHSLSLLISHKNDPGPRVFQIDNVVQQNMPLQSADRSGDH